MNKNQKGFGHLIIIIAVLVIGVVSASGYLVYKNHNKKTSSSVTTISTVTKVSTESTSSTAQATKDFIINWRSVTSSGGAFTIKLPDGWNLQNWNSRDYLSATNYADLGYATGKRAVITSDSSVLDSGAPRRFSVTGNPISQKDSIGYYFNDAPQTFTLLNGSTGKKYTHVYSEEVDGVNKGDKLYQYRFEGSKYLITVNYYVLGKETDQVSIVDKSIQSLTY